MNLWAKHCVSHHSLSSSLLSLPVRVFPVFAFVMIGSILKAIHDHKCLTEFLCVFCPTPRDLDCLGVKNRALVSLPVEEVLQTLNDLIAYFQLPDVELEHEERQIKLRSLKNRQNLFKQEVSFTMNEHVANQLSMKYQLIRPGAVSKCQKILKTSPPPECDCD